jgi:hypothetical protein
MKFTYKWYTRKVYGEVILFVELYLNNELLSTASNFSVLDEEGDRRNAHSKAKYLKNKFLLDKGKQSKYKLDYSKIG